MNQKILKKIFKDIGIEEGVFVLERISVADEIGFRCFFSNVYNCWVTEVVQRNEVVRRYKFKDESSACHKMLELMAIDYPILKKYL